MKLYIQTSYDSREELPNRAATRAELARQLGSTYVEVSAGSYHVHEVKAEPDNLTTILPMVLLGYVGLSLALILGMSMVMGLTMLGGGIYAGMQIGKKLIQLEEKVVADFNNSRIDFEPNAGANVAQAA